MVDFSKTIELRNTVRVAAVAAWFAGAGALIGGPAGASTPQAALINRYCVTCHNQRAKTAGLELDRANLSNPGQDAEIWEQVIIKLRSNAMPPHGMPHPDPDARDAFVSWLENSLDRSADLHPNPGRTILHRIG